MYMAGSTQPLPCSDCELGKENRSHVSYCTIYWMGVISSIINILLREPGSQDRGNSILSFRLDIGYPHNWVMLLKSSAMLPQRPKNP